MQDIALPSSGIMLITALIYLLALVRPVVCKMLDIDKLIMYNVRNPINLSSKSPQKYQEVDLALFCLFTFFFLVLIGKCFVLFIQARGHRSKFAFLLPALVLSLLGNSANITLETQFLFLGGSHSHILALKGLEILSTNWGIAFLYLWIHAVLRDRESAILAATEGRFGQCSCLSTVVHIVLTVLLFAFGTMNMVLYFSPIDIPEMSYICLLFLFKSWVTLTGIAVVVWTISLWRAARAARINEKVLVVSMEHDLC